MKPSFLSLVLLTYLSIAACSKSTPPESSFFSQFILRDSLSSAGLVDVLKCQQGQDSTSATLTRRILKQTLTCIIDESQTAPLKNGDSLLMLKAEIEKQIQRSGATMQNYNPGSDGFSISYSQGRAHGNLKVTTSWQMPYYRVESELEESYN